MSLGDFLTLAALFVSVVALFISVKSLRVACISLEKARRQEHISLLPRMHFIIHARSKMEDWIKTLSEAENIMKRVLDNQDPHLLPQLQRLGLDTPANMIDKPMFELGPDWLSTLLAAAAQYHYSTAGNLNFLSRYKDDKACFRATTDMIGRCRDSIYAIKEILGYINDMIPKVILDCPAFNSEQFLTE
jgi:hypothetical protein